MIVKAYGLCVDMDQGRATYKGRRIIVRPKDARILGYIAKRRGESVPGKEILNAFWDIPPKSGLSAARKSVATVRVAMAAITDDLMLISYYGQGYALKEIGEGVSPLENFRAPRRSLIHKSDPPAPNMSPYYWIGDDGSQPSGSRRCYSDEQLSGMDCPTCAKVLSRVWEYTLPPLPDWLIDDSTLRPGLLPMDGLELCAQCRSDAALMWATTARVLSAAVILYRRDEANRLVTTKVIFADDERYWPIARHAKSNIPIIPNAPGEIPR